MSKANRMLFWVVTGIVIALSVFVVIRYVGEPGSNVSQGALASSVQEDDWVKGSPNADVVIIEYSDFQCPACASAAPLVTDIMSEFGDHVSFVYRHFPLRSIHPNAQLAGQAAEAAGLQGQFWEMHDILFETQSEWSGLSNPEEKFEEYATDLGLDVGQFSDDLDSSATKASVNSDYSGAVRLGLNSTPTFFLNGQRIRPSSLEDFRDKVRTAINTGAVPADASAAPATGHGM